MRTTSILALLLALVVAACGGDDTEAGGDDAITITTASAGQLVPGTGEAIIGDDIYVLNPSLQCGVFPGPTVAIAGTVEDTETEFVIDYDPANDLVGMRIGESSGDDPYWNAQDDAIEFTVDADTVRGTGQFDDGQGNTESGTVEITC